MNNANIWVMLFFSQFDINLRQAWDQAMSLGYFRYTLGDLQTKILPGPVGYVAQVD